MRASVPLDQWKEVELIEKKLTELYRWFFHPDYLTAMDKFIERLYLEEKLRKIASFRSSKVI